MENQLRGNYSMGYLINIDMDGFQLQFGSLEYNGIGKGIWIDFEDEKIKNAIESKDKKLFSSIFKVFAKHEELDALYTMNIFENYYLQGNRWDRLSETYNFEGLYNFKKKAELVLNSDMANEEQIRIAQTIIDVLNGNYRSPPKPQKSLEEKAKSAFEKKKNKLRLKLTIAYGYKCDQCSKNTEDSLCIIRKDDSVLNYDISNLVLRCRSCMNKMKKK